MWFRSSLVLVVLLGLAACGGSDQSASSELSVTGELINESGESFGSDSKVTVSVQDVSIADAPAKILVEESFDVSDERPPVPFEIAMDTSGLDQRRTYALRATVNGPDGSLRWTTDTVRPIDVALEGTVDLGEVTLVPVN